ncbi:unnamed protein product [Calicophoron daubneyi]|uniref:FAD-binding PCMH-type domain-containing protein n=1 Tax=Calicophoron daubneyi TaxID=300641 RepID=A0AAV2T0H3_CALDB
MDPSLLLDPNLVIKLGQELQKRIGALPVVEVYAFHLESQPGEIVRMLRVQPQSYSEIARTVRAARTMKLTVRACGERTGGDVGIYGTATTVLVDCTLLADSPRIEFVNIARKGEKGETQGLRVLASVGISELVAFQVKHRIEIAQSVETTTIWGTVVGAITSTAPGMVGPAGGARGGCLSDEVIAIRVVDCHGDMIQYSSEEDLSSVLSTLGLIGVVYDVTLRYKPISLSKVQYEFIKWNDLLKEDNIILKSSAETNQMTELIYLPFNSCPAADSDHIEIHRWEPMEDEVILHMTTKIPYSIGVETAAKISAVDSQPRQQVHLIDQIFGPTPKELVGEVEKTPWLLQRAHKYLRCRFQPDPISIQYTPWAINSLGKMSEPLRTLRFTIESDKNMVRFKEAMKAILRMMREIATGSARNVRNYAINLGIRVHFTGVTLTGRLMGIGFEPSVEQPCSVKLAHISFNGITSPGPNTMWTKAAARTTMTMLKSIPRCVPQWKTEWHGIELIKERFRELLEAQVEPLKNVIALADRDGVFLNELMASILYPKETFYQSLYRRQREDALPSY